MIDRQISLQRRDLLGLTAGLALASFAWPHRSLALTGVAALDTQSIKVKAPATVLLVAVTITPGKRLVATGEHGVIIYSDDNGISWTQANVPVNVTLTCVSFVTAMTGWAAGHYGAILNTQDGGKNWNMQLDGIQANQLTMQAAQAPSVANDPSPGAPMAMRRARHFSNVGPDNPFFTILVFDSRKVMVFGAYRMTLLTNDGGKTWQDWSLHIYDRYSHNIYDSAAVGNTCYLVLEEGLMFNSTDGGNTFLPMTAPGSVTLFGLLGTSTGALVVFGVAGTVYRSTDGGKTWIQINIATQDDITGGRVTASGALVLTGETGLIFASHDDGNSFIRVPGVPSEPFFDIQQAANGALIAVGAAGVTNISKSLLAS